MSNKDPSLLFLFKGNNRESDVGSCKVKGYVGARKYYKSDAACK
jgi:hypothetical protein